MCIRDRFIIPTMPWGGYPGNKDNDIQSGQGFVHNSFFFESPLKGIVETNFRFSRFIDPPWFVNNKKAHRLFKNLTYYQANNSKINFIKLLFSTLISKCEIKITNCIYPYSVLLSRRY